MTAPSRPRCRIAAIVLNYKTPDLLEDCVPTIAADLDPEQDRVVVVDNASGDDSVARMRALISKSGWSHVSVLESPTNGGFAAGNNAGIASVDARAYFLLNSDTLVLPGASERLWQTMQKDDGIGITSPRLEFPDGSPQISCFRLHTPWSEVIQGSQIGLVRRLLSHWDIPIPVSDHVSEPSWTSFAAVMIKRELIDAVGPLDEGYFMYYEDVDFCRRAGEAGWRIVNDPAAHVVHLRGGTSPVKRLKNARKRRPRYYYASRARYFERAYGPMGPLVANACWTFGRAIGELPRLVGRPRVHTVESEVIDTWRQ